MNRLIKRLAIRAVLRGKAHKVLGIWTRRRCRGGVIGFYRLDLALVHRTLKR
jgi:hypothetical protein